MPETSPSITSSSEEIDVPAARLGFFSKIFQKMIAPFKRSNLRHDLQDALDNDGQADMTFSPEERSMLGNILKMRETRLDNIMVPRVDIIALDATKPLSDVLKCFQESGHSRLPVYEDTLDNPLGMIHIKDIMLFLTEASQTHHDRKKNTDQSKAGCLDFTRIDLSATLKDLNLIRNVIFVPPSMKANDLMATMQATRIQIALVIDEYGGTDGLVSLEDIVETVVGNIEDEHDEDHDSLIQMIGTHLYIADARITLNDLSHALDMPFDAELYTDEADTLGGLIYVLLDRIPARGELINSVPGLELEIVDADPRRIKRIKISQSRKRSTLARKTKLLADKKNTEEALIVAPSDQPDTSQDEALRKHATQ